MTIVSNDAEDNAVVSGLTLTCAFCGVNCVAVVPKKRGRKSTTSTAAAPVVKFDLEVDSSGQFDQEVNILSLAIT